MKIQSDINFKAQNQCLSIKAYHLIDADKMTDLRKVNDF